jgi:hypothetical protein
VAPVNGGAERLVTRQGAAAPAGEQGKPVGQPGEDLLCREDSRPDCGEFDRQREAVEPTAQLGDRRPVGSGQVEVTGCRRRPLREQHDCLVLPQPGERFGRMRRGQLKGRHRDHVLTRHRQRLPAGGDHPYARRRPQHAGDQSGGCSQQMLAVVHDQQQLLVPQIRKQKR